tara:strand:+ start:1920 stop:2279 length:360 start_codon:yes stop_codon:yes gene_type:complete
MDQQTIESMIGQYGWMIAVGFVLLIGRSTIESLVEAIKVFAGDDLNTDDTVIFDGRPARVIRVGFWKTILFVYEVGCADGKPFIKGGNKVAIQNDKLKDHLIEKPLPMLDLKKWDNCNE